MAIFIHHCVAVLCQKWQKKFFKHFLFQNINCLCDGSTWNVIPLTVSLFSNEIRYTGVSHSIDKVTTRWLSCLTMSFHFSAVQYWWQFSSILKMAVNIVMFQINHQVKLTGFYMLSWLISLLSFPISLIKNYLISSVIGLFTLKIY